LLITIAPEEPADLAFEDDNGFYYVIDVKTHRLNTKFTAVAD
jgi:hypothetical protein